MLPQFSLGTNLLQFVKEFKYLDDYRQLNVFSVLKTKY